MFFLLYSQQDLHYQLRYGMIKEISDPTQSNEALWGKINFELWAKRWSKVKISQKLKYAKKQTLT